MVLNSNDSYFGSSIRLETNVTSVLYAYLGHLYVVVYLFSTWEKKELSDTQNNTVYLYVDIIQFKKECYGISSVCNGGVSFYLFRGTAAAAKQNGKLTAYLPPR